MEITAQQAANELLSRDNILILSHQNPDGDTLGCAFSLWYALNSLGKRARVSCPDPLPGRFSYLYREYRAEEFEEQYVVAVDVASLQLLGKLRERYEMRIDLCIDHHPSNGRFAEKNCIYSSAAAACEILFEVIGFLHTPITPLIADCLYTGIATDTGCFRFSNTSRNTHMVAATLFERGADYGFINQYLFETKSRARLLVEKEALNSVCFYYGGRVAVIHISQEMIHQSNVDESELDGISGIPRSIEGVVIGITLREKPDGSQKVSVRTTAEVDAANLCARFGGGGHARAAGCWIGEGEAVAREQLLAACRDFLPD